MVVGGGLRWEGAVNAQREGELVHLVALSEKRIQKGVNPQPFSLGLTLKGLTLTPTPERCFRVHPEPERVNPEPETRKVFRVVVGVALGRVNRELVHLIALSEKQNKKGVRVRVNLTI